MKNSHLLILEMSSKQIDKRKDERLFINVIKDSVTWTLTTLAIIVMLMYLFIIL